MNDEFTSDEVMLMIALVKHIDPTGRSDDVTALISKCRAWWDSAAEAGSGSVTVRS